MPSLDIDIYVSCSNCGGRLDIDASGTDIAVDVCSICLRNAMDESRDEGYEAGFEDGRDDVLSERETEDGHAR
jgi:hypothetical protein